MKTLLATVLFLGAAPESRAPQEPLRPNIVLIHADDLGWGDLSCYGQKKFRTPNLDRMAAEGARFTQYYSGSTVCAPSRYCLMSGIHTGRGYIRGNGELPLRPEDVTLAELLKAAGYATGVFGKWGLGLPDNTGRPDKQGFDQSFGFLSHVHAHRQFTDHLFRNGEKVEIDAAKEWANDLFTKEAVGFIEQHKARPFFVYLAYANPHAELLVPEDSLDEYRGRFEEKPFINKQADGHPSRGYRSQPTPRAAFAAMITRMDRDIGRLFDRLEALGLDGNTLVIFTSDNGPHKEGGADPAFFESSGPFKGIKRDLYEGGIRVPMIVRWPGKVKAGVVSDQVWAHWDVLPTAAELAGVRAPEGIDGLSMVPALLGRPQKSHEFLYWEFHERGFDQAVRMGDWKGVRHDEGAWELYDLKGDRGETDNVAAKNAEAVAKIDAWVRSMRTESERWKITKRKK